MSDEVVHLEELKERLDNDRELFLDICDVFFADFINHVDAISAAIATNSADKLKEHAHTVKGALANLSVKKASAISKEMEIAGRENKANSAGPLFQELLSEIERFREFVEKVKRREIWTS